MIGLALDTVAGWISPRWGLQRQQARSWLNAYHGADTTQRLTVPWKSAQRGSADAILAPSLDLLIARSRDLSRNHPAARAAIEGAVGNLVGTGISAEANTGDATLDEVYTDAFEAWAESAGVDGSSLWAMQYQAGVEWKEAGGFVWRWVVDPERATRGLAPDCLLALSVDWLSQDPVVPLASPSHSFVGGIELDRYGRPVFFHLRHPDSIGALRTLPVGGLGSSSVLPNSLPDERVPASEIIHGYRARRAGQHRGEPEMAPAVLWFWNGHSLIEAELRAAVVGAAASVVVKTRSGGSEIQNMGQPAATGGSDRTAAGVPSLPALGSVMPMGGVVGLFPDEDVTVVENKRPSQQVMPFLQSIWGAIAGCMRISRRLMDKNYAGASFSAQRADEQDTRKLTQPEQNLFARFATEAPWRRMLPILAALAHRPLPINPVLRERMLRCDIHPDGLPYINPVDDIEASTRAIRAGLSDYDAEMGLRGKSRRRVWARLARQQAEAKTLGLKLDLGSKAAAPAPAPAPDPEGTAATPTDPEATP